MILLRTARTTEKDLLNQNLFFRSTAIQFQTGWDLRSGMREVMQCNFRRYFLHSFWRHSWKSPEMNHQWGLGPSNKAEQRLRKHAGTTWAISCLWHWRPSWTTTCLGKCWENCTELAILIPFQQVPWGPWQAASPSLYDLWHKECHRAQLFSHFCLISMQNLQGTWWSIWTAKPAIRLVTCNFMYLFPPHADSTVANLTVLKARAA